MKSFIWGSLGVGILAAGVYTYQQVQASLEIRHLSQEARKIVGPYLVPLEKIDYEEAIGRKPSLDEVELGRMLFNDPIMARNNDVSCATCHLSNHGFADGSSLSFGALGRGGPSGDTVGKSFAQGTLQIDRGCGDDGMGFLCREPMFRNVPSTINVAYRTNRFNNSGLLLDGRFGDLNFQTILPIHTAEELCGANPVPASEELNHFRENGPLFREPVTITHSNLADYVRGINLNLFNAQPEVIRGVPSFRPNGTASIPTRNECLAIAVAKVRAVPEYVKLFEKAYGSKEVSDIKMGRALAAFLATHVSNQTPFDHFVQGENSLTESQLRGMVMFFSPLGEKVNYAGQMVTGVNCNSCHSAPLFGGKGFASLGVVSDGRSPLSKAKIIFTNSSGFVLNIEGQRGSLPNCHKEGVSASATSSYVPDMGRAIATTKEEDCFKFRVPPLRNVVETFPYFHHGSERGQGYVGDDHVERSIYALKKAIRYHLRGPVNDKMINRLSVQRSFFDPFYLKDPLVPLEVQKFSRDARAMNGDVFPLDLNEAEIEDLAQFVAWGLYDPQSVAQGDLGNDVSHPQKVPSGLSPSVTRERGHQAELPPAANFHKTQKFSLPQAQARQY